LLNQVCLFFYVNGECLIHGCNLDEAESYGDFLIYPSGHFDVWERDYAEKYGVDYDYYPRGRVAYHKPSETFRILHDRCLERSVLDFLETRYEGKTTLGYDEHYQCHKCNRDYVI